MHVTFAQGKAKKTRKFAEVKRIIDTKKDVRVYAIAACARALPSTKPIRAAVSAELGS